MDRTPEGNYQDVAPMSSSGVNDGKAREKAGDIPCPLEEGGRNSEDAGLQEMEAKRPADAGGVSESSRRSTSGEAGSGRGHISPIDAWAEGLIDG